MQPHNSSHAVLLERILVGDLPRTAAEARALVDHCAECSERLRELDLLQSQLAAAGEEERAGVAQAAAGVLAPDSQRRIQEFVGAGVQRSRATSRRGRLVALAIAASLCAVIGYRLIRPATPERPGPGSGDVILDADQGLLRGISPQGPKASFADFTWSARPLEADETFRLQVTNLDAPDSDPLVIANIEGALWRRASARVAESRRVEEFFARGPRKIEWTVEICKAGRRAVLTSQPVQASLD